MEKLIETMKKFGWQELPNGQVHHPEFATCGSWEEAMLACIEVASDYSRG
jgi:hypothetical protein